MKKGIIYVLVLLTNTAFSQVNIIPAPVTLEMGQGNFVVSATTKIILEGSDLEKAAKQLNAYLKKQHGYALKIEKAGAGNAAASNSIVLNYERMDNPIPGAYTMEVNKKQVYIAGDNAEGVFYGIQTLIQLLPVKKKPGNNAGDLLSIPQLSITDHPRFAYRGAHLDVSRHFFTAENVKRYIDYLAAYKYNTFHWHLTDDQGWRIEIKKYPGLTAVGGYRNGTIIGRYPGKGNDSIHYGGFYTQQQIKEIVQYAADRYIEVIPEIEMPGHASAAIAAYPQLSCFPDEDTKVPESTPWAGSRKGKQVQQTWGVFEDVFSPGEYTFRFLQDVIDEITPLFPSKYIHIGGDECPKVAWERSAFCQQLIKDSNLKDEHGLQSYFIHRMEKYINSKGKKIIGWNEILEGGLAPNATVMSWQGEKGGITAARENHDVIMTPESFCYLDHSQSKNEDSVTIGGYLPLEKVYSYDPFPESLTAAQLKHILGAQVNVWTEYIGNMSKLEYTIFPRMIAFSEVLWSPNAQLDWQLFEKRLPVIFEKLDAQKINHSNAYYDLKTSVEQRGNNITWKLQSNNSGAHIVYTKNNRDLVKYTEPVPVTADVSLRAALADGGNKIISNWVTQSFHFNKATGKRLMLKEDPSDNYPGSGFTLTDGVQNTMGMVRSSEFLGYQGKDLEATIDLGTTTFINEISLHAFEQKGSWIYRPAAVSFYSSADNVHFKLLETTTTPEGKMQLTYNTKKTEPARFVKVVAKNAGIISGENPGAGSPAWLFVDEIEVK